MGLFLALWGEANAFLLFKNTWCALCKQSWACSEPVLLGTGPLAMVPKPSGAL